MVISIAYLYANSKEFIAEFLKSVLSKIILEGFLAIGYINKSYQGGELPSLTNIFLGANIITLVALIIVISSDRGKAGIRMTLNMFEPNLPRSILKSSYIISGSVIASSLFVFIPNLLLSVFGEASDIAIFAVCFQLAYTPLIALQPVKMSYMPKVAKSFREKNVNKLVSVILRSAGSFILFGSVPSIIVLLLSNKILLLYGENYLDGARILVILALSNALICAMGPVGDFMDMLGKEKLRFQV